MKNIFLLLFVSVQFVAQAQANKEVMGTWLSENKKQKVKVFYLESTKKYYGKITWMYEDDQEAGRTMLDVNNPNPALRSRRMTGTLMMMDFEQEARYKYRGYVYNPISGKKYRCLLTLRPDFKTAEIRGYIFHPWIGRTEIATKISE
jgi:uncharacterized protein (DUF2147 family)